MANVGKLSVTLIAVGASIALSWAAQAGPPTPTPTPTPTATPTPTPTPPPAGGGLVTLCHQKGKAVTVQIGANSVPAHLKHGDTLGECP